MDGLIHLSTVLTVAATILSLLLGGYVALAKWAITQKERELELRDQTLRKDVNAAVADVKALEDAQVRLNLAVELNKHAHDTLAGIVHDIRTQMVTKVEFDARIDSMKSSVDSVKTSVEQILYEIRKPRSGQYIQKLTDPPPTKR